MEFTGFRDAKCSVGQAFADAWLAAFERLFTCVKAGTPPAPSMEKGCVVNEKPGPAGGTFSFKCPPPNAMESEGEMTFGAGTMSATIRAKTEGLTIVILQAGRK